MRSDTTVAPPRLWRHPIIAAAICIAVLVLSALPTFSKWILTTDNRAAIALNASIGVSPVIDHVILAFADNSADDRILILVTLGFMFYCWRARTRRRRAARIALFLFMIFATAAALFLQEAVDETVRRPSPAYNLAPFQNIAKIYDDSVKVKERESFPSEHGMFYFFIGFVLLRTGKMVGGTGFVLAGLILPLAKCTVGSEWLSDTYLGALPLAFLSSAIAVETPVFQIKLIAEQRILQGLDKLSIILKGKRHFFDGSFLYGTRDIFRIEASIKRFIRDHLLQFTSNQRMDEVKIEMPLAGVRSIVRFVTLSDRKVLLRIYPLNRRVEAELHRDASETLAGHHINAPRILNYSDNPRRYGVRTTCRRIHLRGKPPIKRTHRDPPSQSRTTTRQASFGSFTEVGAIKIRPRGKPLFGSPQKDRSIHYSSGQGRRNPPSHGPFKVVCGLEAGIRKSSILLAYA